MFKKTTLLGLGTWIICTLTFLLLSELYLARREFVLAKHHDIPIPIEGHSMTCGYHPDQEISSVTTCVWPNGMRASYPAVLAPRPYRVLLIGCSYTFGMGLFDDETYAWQLHEALPNCQFDNSGVPGYGTVQSLQILRERLEQKRYNLVLYGLINDHIISRNTKPNICLTGFDTVVLPRAEVDSSGELKIFPAREVIWWGDDRLRLINLLKSNWYLTLQMYYDRTYVARKEDYQVAIMLMREMRQLCLSQGTQFGVVSLDKASQNLQRHGLKESWIFEAIFPQYFNSSNYHTGDGREQGNHPDERVHSFYAQRIAQWISENPKLPQDMRQISGRGQALLQKRQAAPHRTTRG